MVGFSVFRKLDHEWVRWHISGYMDQGHRIEGSSMFMLWMEV